MSKIKRNTILCILVLFICTILLSAAVGLVSRLNISNVSATTTETTEQSAETTEQSTERAEQVAENTAANIVTETDMPNTSGSMTRDVTMSTNNVTNITNVSNETYTAWGMSGNTGTWGVERS